MSDTHPEPDDADLTQRLDEERHAGRSHRPMQTPATESVEVSVDEERRAATSEED